MSDVHLIPYGVASTFDLELFKVDGVDLRVDATFSAGDVKHSIDEGDEANADNLPTDEGQYYAQVISATEATGKRVAFIYVDSATKVWLDRIVVCETYGHPLAMHPDIGVVSPNQGTAQAVTATSVTLATSAVADADFYNGMIVEIVSATTGAVQSRYIEGYTAARVATVVTWDVTPTGTITYRLIPAPPSPKIAEPAQSAPPTKPTAEEFMSWLWMMLMNETAQTDVLKTIKDSGGTVIAKQVVSDDGTTGKKLRWVAGP